MNNVYNTNVLENDLNVGPFLWSEGTIVTFDPPNGVSLIDNNDNKSTYTVTGHA